MKSVLLSIKPKNCVLIANGIKTVEVRKTRPKLKTPCDILPPPKRREYVTFNIGSFLQFLLYPLLQLFTTTQIRGKIWT